MKIITGLTTLATLALFVPVASADRAFNATAFDKDGKAKIKSGAKFANGGAKMELCPSGNCESGQLITLSMSKLEEINPVTNRTVQKSTNFAALQATWTAFEPIVINGVDAMTTSFVTSFTVKNAAGPTSFNLTAMIFSANGTTQNGNQTIDVPAGALKFAVTIGDWPFEAETNRLVFGVTLKARGKSKDEKTGMTKKPKPKRSRDVEAGDASSESSGAGGAGTKTHSKIERVEMGEGMFMDAPTLAVVDGVDTAINATIEVVDAKTEFVWSFPHFADTLYYDPVVGVEAEASTSLTPDTTTTPPATPPTTAPSPSQTNAPPTSTPASSDASAVLSWNHSVMSSVAVVSAFAIGGLGLLW